MKKLFFAVFAVMLALCSCQMDELDGYVEEDVLYVKIEDSSATKTYMGAGNKVLWSDGDQIAAYLKSYDVQKYQVTGESVGNSSAIFTKVSGNASSGNSSPQHNLAFYPYSLVSGFSQSGNNYVAEVTIPSSQTYNSESFDDGFFPMAAVSKDNTLSFRNICGAVNLRLIGSQKVKSVSLSGNSGEKISGAGTVTVYPDNSAPYLKLKSSASSSVTLDCGDGVQLNESQATSFVIVLPPVNFSKGFTITVTDSEGEEYEIKTDKSNSVSRSNIHAIPVQTLGENFGETDAPEYIDEYGVNQGPGVEIDGVVWAPVNCGYHETDYKYGKLYQWGRKYGQGYSGSIYDINGNYVEKYSDATVPSIESGPVSLIVGQSKNNSNVFYTSDCPFCNYDWLSPQSGNLWNAGSESDPVKTEYDPCPAGWRVPTDEELDNLIDNYSSWTIGEKDQVGRWFSGLSSYSSNSPRIFLPAAGYHYDTNGDARSRGSSGYYWSSRPNSHISNYTSLDSGKAQMSSTDRAKGSSVRCVHDQSELITVSSVIINNSSLTMEIGETQTLSATITPSNANHKTAYWCSDDEAIANVDGDGKVTAVSSGVATITAIVGMQSVTCIVTVNAPTLKNYVDEYGINQGTGIDIDGVVWAPVNCGYHETEYKYGKLYQWGRKYGQGYSGDIYDIDGNYVEKYSDASVPSIKSGPVSLSTGQSKSNSNVFYTSDLDYNRDWLYPQDDDLWNSGTDSYPVKTEYDPCPEGWRVPTLSELDNLSNNYSSLTTDEKGLIGLWFSGSSSYSSNVPRIFFPAAGYRNYDRGDAHKRGSYGSYWSSRPHNNNSYYLGFSSVSKYYNNDERAYGSSIRCVQDDAELIPVSSVRINKSSLTIEIGETLTLSATISPSNANHKTAYWCSDDEAIATVDENGRVTAVSSGVVTITAVAGMQSAVCKVTVSASASNAPEYIDEYGVNQGPGVEIDGVVWAPVNCGYHKTDYKYGKLYQWGRKYGQGYSGNIYDIDGNYVEKYSDASLPSIEPGPVSLATGQSKSNSNVFYTSDSNYNYDWLYPEDDNLWNSGSEDNPVKTEYDPCPDGWRVPTYPELENLSGHYSSWTIDEKGQIGYWFSGSSSYSSKARIFLPAAGYRAHYSGGALYNRGDEGYYWSSRPRSYFSSRLYFSSFVGMSNNVGRAYGHSVRCVKE